MGSTSGIGSAQQTVSSVAVAETKPVAQVDGADTGAANVHGSSVAHTDHADLSSVGGLVARALQESDARSTKVAALQASIASGSYSVSSSHVADKLIQTLSVG